ncbi:MAG: 16S rRNA (cytosine(1402)-N(4))-methyltransferase RsmH [Bacteroidales bacterium]|nr:16S rRNA (cytosine(1402)-N(4))-methyltransferase RsmH [Candidatus Sodaliphilus aphodohippi]
MANCDTNIGQPVYHIPALLTECMEGLDIKPDGVYVDVTFGGGGHSRAIIERLGDKGHLYGLDQDMDAWQNRIADPRFTFVHSNFAYLKNFMRFYGVDGVDGILADLGVSFHHFDDSERGFSFRFDGRLDMRMNRDSSLDAVQVVNEYSEERLADILYLYGELKQARRMASAIVKARQQQTVETTGRLVEIVRPFIKPNQEKKEMAMVFQALRIEVNHEIDALRRLLESSLDVLRPGGRLAVITYHSLEDRLVKNFIRSGNIEGKVDKDFYGQVHCPLRAVNNRVIVPNEQEVENNPRSRSAKLRIAQRV